MSIRMPSPPSDFEEVINNGPYKIRFPKKGTDLEQNEEWCEVFIDNTWKKIRFHDYSEVYKIPGLYETLFYRTLRCNSPYKVSNLLDSALVELSIDPAQLRVLDFGAGNGMAAEALHNIGVRHVVGVDLLPEAEMAVNRDRPWVYDHYKVADFTRLSPQELEFFRSYNFNTLCTVAALGFGDIPPKAFFQAFNLIADGGLIAFNIRDTILKGQSNSAFSTLIDRMIHEDAIQIEVYKRYQHRLNTNGEPLFYVGIVCTKNYSIPEDWLN